MHYLCRFSLKNIKFENDFLNCVGGSMNGKNNLPIISKITCVSTVGNRSFILSNA